MFMQSIIGIIVILVLWSLWGFFSSKVEQADYSVVGMNSDYEIRNYPAHIVAQTTVKGSYKESLNIGFRIVAGYIFGGNTKKQSISMTSPVTEQTNSSQKVAMTAPVIASIEGEEHIISFGMPRNFTLDTLPTPNDSRVRLVEIPVKKMAVLRFSWYRSDARVLEKKQELLSYLSRDSIVIVGTPQYAGYNAPWTPPWMSRHEVMVEIQ